MSSRDPTEPYDAGNPDHVREAKQASKGREMQRIAGLGLILDSPEARIWLWHLLTHCGVRRQPYRHGDADGTSFNCGQLDVGLMIEAELVKHYPKGYLQLMTEQGEHGH